MDCGGIIMNRYLSPDNKSRHSRKTTDTFEMANGIIMQTSIQCVAMQPNNLEELPSEEIEFLSNYLILLTIINQELLIIMNSFMH